jgi:hypothetical protein
MPATKKTAPIASNPRQPTPPLRVRRRGPSESASRSALDPRRQKAETVGAQLVFADQMARVEFRPKDVEPCEEYDECER